MDNWVCLLECKYQAQSSTQSTLYPSKCILHACMHGYPTTHTFIHAPSQCNISQNPNLHAWCFRVYIICMHGLTEPNPCLWSIVGCGMQVTRLLTHKTVPEHTYLQLTPPPPSPTHCTYVCTHNNLIYF